jgi:hypothetical protein
MARRKTTTKRGAARSKATRAKKLKDLAPAAKGKKVKGGLVCIPIISIPIIMLPPCSPVGGPCGPSYKPPVKK